MDKKNHEGSFKKAIGPFSGISIVAGMVIGSGVYYLGSYVLERTGMSLGWLGLSADLLQLFQVFALPNWVQACRWQADKRFI